MRLAGIVQEQHPDRARLFMQWTRMDWPVLVDAFNLLNVSEVPITLAIDEHGVIRHVNPPQDTIEEVFIGVTYPAPDTGAPVRDVVPEPHAGPDAVIAACDEALRSAPESAALHFRRGVALRARHDSPARHPGDFAAAVESWQRALDLDPNQYIWRRRLQQYGPRLEKPYPFYDWVRQARDDVRARGEAPVSLLVEPDGAEIAHPASAFADESGPAGQDPDPDGRILRDDGEFIRLETVLVPPMVSPGGVCRVHLEFHPVDTRRAHWNNEADGLVVWIDPSTNGEVERRTFTVPNPAPPTSMEMRRVEVEVRAPAGHHDQDVRLRGHALYYVCEDSGGTCLYRRQDIDLAIPVRQS